MIPGRVASERLCALVAVWALALALFLFGPASAQTRIYPGTGQSCPAGTHLLMLSNPNYPDCQCDTPVRGNLCDLREPSTACFCLPDPQIDTLVIDPRYWVLTILHVPQGRQSSVTYGASSNAGSRVEVKGSLYNGFDVKVESSLTVQEQKFESGTIDGVSVETRKTVGSTMSLDAQDDVINYGKDTFVIWTNPRLTITDDHFHPPVLTLSAAGGAPPQYVNVTVEELGGDVSMPEWKKAGNFVQIGSTSNSSSVTFHDTPPGDSALPRLQYGKA